MDDQGKPSAWWYVGVFVVLNIARQVIFPPSEVPAWATVVGFVVVLAITLASVGAAHRLVGRRGR